MFSGAPLTETKIERVAEAVGWLNTILTDKTWVAGNEFSVADLSITVTISQLQAFGFDLNTYNWVHQWFQKCKDTLKPYGYKVSKLVKFAVHTFSSVLTISNKFNEFMIKLI